MLLWYKPCQQLKVEHTFVRLFYNLIFIVGTNNHTKLVLKQRTILLPMSVCQRRNETSLIQYPV